MQRLIIVVYSFTVLQLKKFTYGGEDIINTEFGVNSTGIFQRSIVRL